MDDIQSSLVRIDLSVWPSICDSFVGISRVWPTIRELKRLIMHLMFSLVQFNGHVGWTSLIIACATGIPFAAHRRINAIFFGCTREPHSNSVSQINYVDYN